MAEADTTAILFRGIKRDAARRFSRGARVRGITLAAYLERLIDFHDDCRRQADTGNRGIAADLAAFGLETVVE